MAVARHQRQLANFIRDRSRHARVVKERSRILAQTLIVPPKRPTEPDLSQREIGNRLADNRPEEITIVGVLILALGLS